MIRVAVLAAAAALLGSMLLFVGNSLRTMSSGAVRGVALDWQGPVSSYAQAKRVAADTSRQSAIAQASPTATAPFAQAQNGGGSGTTTAGSGSVLAVPPGYLSHVRTFHFLHGGLRRGYLVLDQQMAATLKAGVGSTVLLKPAPAAGALPYRVSGIAVVTEPEVLFQPLNPQLGPAPAQPPANVAIMPVASFAATYARHLRTVTPASVGSSAQPGAQDGVQWQVQAQVDPRSLSGLSPARAYARAGQVRNRVERSLPGQVQFVDNLYDGLNTAAEDALYAESMYVLLAVPGAIVALGLAYLAALGTVERDRRDLALLRARGASRRDLLGLAGAESVVLGGLAGLTGTALAMLAVKGLLSGPLHLNGGRVALTAGLSVLLATVGAACARLAATASLLRSSVAEARRRAHRPGRPLWQRLHIDLAALAVSGLVWWLTARTGFSAVVNPDSNPTLSLSAYMFLAPALLWIGATLLLVRLRGELLAAAARRAARAPIGGAGGFLLASAARRAGPLNRGLVVLGLVLAFGVQLGIFAATWDRQATVDAQLSLGADVVANAPPGVAARQALNRKIARQPGIEATTALDHSYAYVGPDLQDTYGIDARSFRRATSLRDSYFRGGTASQMMARLRSTPDGILVAGETITDYALKPGSLLRLRVLDRARGRFHVVPFHVVGTVQEFPSAPKDSFMVANLGYLQRVSRGAGPNVVFAKASGNPDTAARRVARATAADGTDVRSIRQQTKQTVSSITTVSLDGISRIEQVFVVILAAAAMGLFVALAVSERRHEFATMVAVGASARRVGAFLWTEAAMVLGAGALLAAGLGWLLSKMLVAMLTHAFDPPPDALAVPWGFLGELAAATLGAAIVATLLAGRVLGRLRYGEILREQ
ncbi:MAG: FtsX-like permease family protein [Thermoleophilaceae bacterium]